MILKSLQTACCCRQTFLESLGVDAVALGELLQNPVIRTALQHERVMQARLFATRPVHSMAPLTAHPVPLEPSRPSQARCSLHVFHLYE